MGFTLLTLLFAFGAILKVTEESTEQNYTVISTSPPPSECQDSKNEVFKLQLQLEIQKALNELKDNANQMKNIKQDILSDIEKLIDDKLEKFESLQKDKDPPSDCKDVQNQGKNTSGVYLIKPNPLKRSIRVWCDMTTRGGGWTYAINRFEGSQDFYLKWANYKFGFGNPSREYWIGLEPLHQITSNKPTELLIELVDWEDKRVYANYKNFEIGSEAEGFNLKNVGDYSGDAGDCFVHDAPTAPKFTTKDKDHDTHATVNCANLYPGAWWHVACFRCHLTGRYRYKYESNLTQSQVGQGIHWWKDHLYSLKEARMMVRPQDTCSVSSNYNSEIQDLKNTVALLQMQLDIRTVLNDLKDNLYKQQKIKQIILKEIETLIDNRLTTSKREIIDEIEKRQPQCQVLPTDCKDAQSRGNNTSGIYLIKPEASKTSFRVWCDMTTKGGGWVYVINRFDGSQDFYLNWPDYKYGFGDITKEFWLGLEHLYELTNSKANELLVELVDWSDHKAYANYKFFEIGDESEGYDLKSLGDYSGDAGDSFHPDAATKPKFSTKDKDQDQDARNCATVYPGAWWHTKCFNAHLMGKYRPKSESNLTSDQFAQGIHWKEYRGYYYSLKEVRMMLRPQEIFKV